MEQLCGQSGVHLWQLDLIGGIYLADGRECKMLTGIDDHSRFVVIARYSRYPTVERYAMRSSPRWTATACHQKY